jgi:hypothetical protein
MTKNVATVYTIKVFVIEVAVQTLGEYQSSHRHRNVFPLYQVPEFKVYFTLLTQKL